MYIPCLNVSWKLVGHQAEPKHLPHFGEKTAEHLSGDFGLAGSGSGTHRPAIKVFIHTVRIIQDNENIGLGLVHQKRRYIAVAGDGGDDGRRSNGRVFLCGELFNPKSAGEQKHDCDKHNTSFVQ
jgi:hypothetical protein